MTRMVSVRQTGRLLVGLLFLSLPWNRQLSFRVGAVSLSLADVIIMIGGLLLMSAVMHGYTLRKPPQLAIIGVGLLFFGGLLSLVAADDITVALHTLASISLKVLMVWLIVDSVEDMCHLKQLIFLYIIAAVVISIAAIGQQVANMISGVSVQSVAGTLSARNEMVYYVVPGFLMALTFMIAQGRSGLNAWLFGLAAAICFVAVVLSRGRVGVFIATILGLTVILIRLRQLGSGLRFMRIILSIGLLFGALALGSTFLTAEYVSHLVGRYSGASLVNELADQRGSTFVRFLIIDGLLRAWLESPLIGIGLGTFKDRSPEYIDMMLLGPNVAAVQPHNAYLGLLAEAGVFALAGLLLLVTKGVGVLLQHRSGLYCEQGLRVAAGIGFVAVCLNLLTFDGLTRYVFWIFLALTLVVGHRLKGANHEA